MKKVNFVTLVLAVIGGLLFSIGMCMCLLPEWNAFTQGIYVTAVGFVGLLVLFIVRWVADGRKLGPVNWKLVGKITYGTVSALVFGTGMCMIMVWNMFLYGILVGIAGIVLLLGLIPMLGGLK